MKRMNPAPQKHACGFSADGRTGVLRILILHGPLRHPHLHALLPVGLGLHVLGEVPCKQEDSHVGRAPTEALYVRASALWESCKGE